MALAYRFASFELRPKQRQLLADGHPVAPIDTDGVAALAARASRYLVF